MVEVTQPPTSARRAPLPHASPSSELPGRAAVSLAASAGDVSAATVSRLPVYLRVLTEMAAQDSSTVSSEELADSTGVRSAVVRRDMASLKLSGTRGVGYSVDHLIRHLTAALGLTDVRPIVIVGAGKLGQALVHYPGFLARNFTVVQIFDINDLVGTTVHGCQVSHSDELESFVRRHQVDIAVLATPAHVSQQMCDRLVAAGVHGVLNFAPVVLSVPDGVAVRDVDLSGELQILAFHVPTTTDSSPEARQGVAS